MSRVSGVNDRPGLESHPPPCKSEPPKVPSEYASLKGIPEQEPCNVYNCVDVLAFLYAFVRQLRRFSILSQ